MSPGKRSNLSLYRHASSTELNQALTERIARTLAQGLAARGHASLVVSGGSTPRPILGRLADLDIRWSDIWVTLADERWVAPDSEASNERMVRETLLRGQAAGARFVPLKTPSSTPEAAVAALTDALARMPRPFDLVQLGMGNDGHTASLFPRVAGAGLDPRAPAVCLAVHPDNAPHPRLSLSLSALLDSREILLLISGEEKWRVFEQAMQPGSIDEMPVRAVLHQDTTPVSVYWCP